MTRFFDILLSFIAIVLLLPLFIPLFLILKLTGEGYIFYLQERIGKGAKPFHVIKFATMLKDSPNMDGGYLTRKGDPRILPVGKFLRKTKINELPQLFNIFAGSMSFVGPRPQAPVHFNLYSDRQKEYIARQIPGLTGLGSVIFRDEEELLERSGMDYDYFHDKVITPYKGELEIWYAENKNLGIYFKILFLTALSVLRPEGNYYGRFKGLPELSEELKPLLTSDANN